MKKLGLDYFPFPTANDEKIELYISRYGNKGYTVFIALLQKIYSEQGYYWLAEQDARLLFARKHGMSGSFVDSVIEYLVNKNYFDKGLYDQYGVLTNTEIQEVYLQATSRRKVQFHEVKYLTSFIRNILKNVNNSKENVNNFKKNVNADTGKEKKVKETEIKREEIDPEFLSKFSSQFNDKEIDIKLVSAKTNARLKEQGQALIDNINDSEFLKTAKNITLKSILKNAKSILEGNYKDYNRNSQTNPYIGRKYTAAELEGFYTDLDNVEI